MSARGKTWKPSGKLHKQITDKQLALVDAYFRLNFNKYEAMLAVGYSPKSARGTIPAVFGNHFIQAEIDRRLAKNRENFELNEKWVIDRLKKIADGSLGGILTKLKESGWDIASLTADEQYLLTEFTEDTKGGRKVKVADRIAALTALGRHLGLFQDKVELSGGVALVEKLQRGREQARLNSGK